MPTDPELKIFDLKQKLTKLHEQVHYLHKKNDRLREQIKRLDAKIISLKQLILDAPLLERQIRDLKLELGKRDFLIAELRSSAGGIAPP